MSDTRFTTAYGSVDELLAGVDIDDLEDLDTLLMILFARPVGVEGVWADLDDEEPSSLEVIVSGDEFAVGSTFAFPVSVLDLVRGTAETVEELGPYTRNDADPRDAVQKTGSMSDDELIDVLQRGLGQVRIFAMLDGNE